MNLPYENNTNIVITNCVEMRNVTKEFHTFKLDRVNLEVPKGKIVGFIGENGAGKSTTINLLLNLIEKDDGEINVFGLHYPKDETRIKQQIGVAFDECFYPEELTPNDIEIILSGAYKKWDHSLYCQLLQKFSVPKEQKIASFSRGMKMKLGIATAISHHAKLLILDEATSGLDPVVRDEVLDMLMEYVKLENASILFSLHIISDVEKVADIVVLINNGQVVFQEKKEMLLQKYRIFEGKTSAFVKNISKRKTDNGIQYLIDISDVQLKPEYRMATLEEILLFFMKGDTQCED